MFKSRYALPGTPPATLIPLAPGEASMPVIRWVEYDANTFTEHAIQSIDELPPPDPADGKVHWIEFNGLGDLDALKALGEKYGSSSDPL